MATSSIPSAYVTTRGETRADSVPWHVLAVVGGAASILIGIIWDISWHMTIGRDTFWTPAHMAVYLGGTLAGLSCGVRVLRDSFWASGSGADDGVRLWKYFVGPVGGWICIWGAFAMLTSAPFDDWWHSAYGLDVEILSPPHVILLAGIAGILMGAQVLAASAQNRHAGSPLHARIFAISSGVLVTMAAIAITDYMWIGRQHQSTFFIVTGALFPVILVAASRASSLRWTATFAAGMYVAIMAAQVWVFPLFPATPKLGPIGHEVTHMVPMPFPVLLIAPAIAIDLIVQRRGDHPRKWLTALLLGLAFLAAFAIVQWPFAKVLASELGRHPFFGGGFSDYGTDAQYLVGPRELWSEEGGLSATILRTIGWGGLAATLSARLGLRRGDWMRRVVR